MVDLPEWAITLPDALAKYGAARLRHDGSAVSLWTLKEELRKAFGREEIDVLYYASNGQISKVHPRIWRLQCPFEPFRDGALDYWGVSFLTSNRDSPWLRLRGVWLYIRQAEFQQWLATRFPFAIVVDANNKSTSSKPGAKPRFDWSELEAIARRLIAKNGIPDPKLQPDWTRTAMAVEIKVQYERWHGEERKAPNHKDLMKLVARIVAATNQPAQAGVS